MKQELLEINGLKLSLWTWGNPKSPPLFFIHGFADSGKNFQWVAENLKNQYFCIAPDLRGHGHSEKGKSPLGYFFYEYIADIHQIFDHYSPNEPVLAIGHSMGGNIVSLYGGACPDRVKAFINIEGLGIRDRSRESAPKVFSNWLHGEANHFKEEYSSISEFAEKMKKRNPYTPLERCHSIAENLLVEKKKDQFVLMVDPLHFLPNPYIYRFENVAPFFRAHKGSILFIESEHTNMDSWMTPLDLDPKDKVDFRIKETERRLSFYPKHQKIVIKNCGHMIHYDLPVELSHEVENFFKANEDHL
ncbi:MAG: alpha/beta hydrolase [Bdellovibrionota bacterium]|nr:alpha/beta hydrolase [Bdellovibrionota bacterium]